MRRYYGNQPRGLAGLAEDLHTLGAIVRTVRGVTDPAEAPSGNNVIELVEVSPGVFAAPTKARTANPHPRAARAARELERGMERVNREASRVDREVRGVLEGLDQLSQAFRGRRG